jgi:hypothetical protein
MSYWIDATMNGGVIIGDQIEVEYKPNKYLMGKLVDATGPGNCQIVALDSDPEGIVVRGRKYYGKLSPDGRRVRLASTYM